MGYDRFQAFRFRIWNLRFRIEKMAPENTPFKNHKSELQNPKSLDL